MKLFSIRDHKADGFNRPFVSATRNTAMREVSAGLRSDTTMANYAQDFTLHEIGDFDSGTGRLSCESTHPYHLCDIKDLVEKEPDANES